MRILYLDIDTLRPDTTSAVTIFPRHLAEPRPDRRRGVRFDNCYTSDAPCLPSRSALMTGTFGIHNGVINHDGFNADFRPEGRNRNFQTG
jgi:arylsulfatase A-like enzyme